MSALSAYLADVLGPEVDDPDEETFLLFAHDRPAAQNLGFIDPHAAVLSLPVAGRDLVVHQSPTVLASHRAGGTTGAVLWRITPAVAAWLSGPGFLWRGLEAGTAAGASILSADSIILELGCGVSGVIGLVLAGPRPARPPVRKTARRPKRGAAAASSLTPPPANAVARYVLTDQPYVAKLVQRNLDANGAAPSALYFRALDWETDIVSATLAVPASDDSDRRHASHSHPPSFDAVLACDCIYNEALIAPLVQTCVDACRLRTPSSSRITAPPDRPTLCIVAQQLRNPDVLTAWLTAFHAAFYVWRVPEDHLPPDLHPNAGFAVHVGILRETETIE